jgi:hypothetical protein
MNVEMGDYVACIWDKKWMRNIITKNRIEEIILDTWAQNAW